MIYTRHQEMCQSSEAAWAAGFFDGEGTVTAGVNGKPTMKVGQVHREVLDRFGLAVGEGRVYGPYKHGRRETPIWMWEAGGQNQIIRALTILWPFLSSVKRDQARARINAYEAKKSKGWRSPVPLPWSTDA